MKDIRRMIRWLVIIVLICDILWDNYKDSSYYQNKILYDVITTFKQEELIYMKGSIIHSNQRSLAGDIREYTDLEWWKQNGKEIAEYRTQANFEADLIKREQNNLLFQPMGELINALKTLELSEEKNVINENRDLQIKVELYNKTIKDTKPRPYKFNIDIYLEDEVITLEKDRRSNSKRLPVVLEIDDATKKIVELLYTVE